MKSLSRTWRIALLSMLTVLAVTACSDDDSPEDAVPNPGVGTIQANQVVAATPEARQYYASQYSFDFNEDGLLSAIRDAQTGEIKATYQYGKGTRSSSEQTRQTNKLSSGQVLMTIRQTDTYIFHFLFSIGGNGFANTCIETNYENTRSPWKFAYNADGRLVQLNDDGDITSFKYDAKGRMTSLYNHDSPWEATFTYGDALCTPYPKDDMGWINLPESFNEIEQQNNDEFPDNDLTIIHISDLPNTAGFFPAVCDFNYEDPGFIYAYLGGLIGHLSSALPARTHMNYSGGISDVDYAYLYLIENNVVKNFRRYNVTED